MSDKRFTLIALLSDGKFHSGEAIGEVMGVSRAAVWKLVQSLGSVGLTVQAVSGRGYRLTEPLELLDKRRVSTSLVQDSSELLERLEIHQILTSSNSYLMQQAVAGVPGGFACLTEFQEAGRGRRGREWISPYGSNIYLSLLWRFNDGASRLGGLSLAVAVSVMRALSSLGLRGAGIKWPNDILVDGKKLAGVLVEVAGESNGPCHAVIGLGVNYSMPEQSSESISQPWTDLKHCGIDSGRNEVAGRVLGELLLAVSEYERHGLDAFRAEWQEWDITSGKTVCLTHGEERIYGVACGIDERGLLLLKDENGISRYASGEISLRTVSS